MRVFSKATLLILGLSMLPVQVRAQTLNEPLPLSLTDAIQRALTRNVDVLVAAEDVEHARGTHRLTIGDLRPDLEGTISGVRQTVNLAALGLPLPAGFPSIVGPFNVFDARLSLSQTLFDIQAINAGRAEGHNLSALEHSYRSTRDTIVFATANLYLQVLAAAARFETVQAQLETADALHRQAVDLKNAGLVAGIDVLRAELQLGTERQRSTAAKNDWEKTKLQLAHAIGLPLGQEFVPSDDFPDVPDPDITLEDALESAYASRPDYQAALERVQAADNKRRAAAGERLPSVQVDASFGTIGLSVVDSRSTYAVSGTVTVPIFDGGRTNGRLVEAEATLRQRRAQADDVKAEIYYEVRSAFLDLRATAEQLQVAAAARTLADLQLTQARDRFAAGVSDNIEVVQSQEGVALANDQFIAALYGHNVSKARLARDVGVAEEALRQYLEGTQ